MSNQPLNEIRFDDKDVILKDNQVNTPILPQKTDQLKRSIIIEGNVECIGAIFGEKILIHNGNVNFHKAGFANSEFVIDTAARGEFFFSEQIGANDVISASLNVGTAYFGSDINSKRIVLKNCFVGGSIYGEEIIIENCVVIGGVFASKTLVVRNCVIGTFNSQTVTMEGKNYLIYPSAFSVEPINYSSFTQLYCITLCDLMDVFKGDEQSPDSGMIEIKLDKDGQRTNLKADDGTILLVNSYSVAGRVLTFDVKNFEKLNNHFLINAGALSGQLMKEYEVKNKEGKTRKLDIKEIASFFFDIIDGRISFNEIGGEVDFSKITDTAEENS